MSLSMHTKTGEMWLSTERFTVGDTKPKRVFSVAGKDTSSIDVRVNSNDEFGFPHRHWEFAEDDCVSVKFALRSNIAFWENNLNPSYFVLNVLENGYLLPLKQKPPSFVAPNN